jgi:hypothetical protein
MAIASLVRYLIPAICSIKQLQFYSPRLLRELSHRLGTEHHAARRINGCFTYRRRHPASRTTSSFLSSRIKPPRATSLTLAMVFVIFCVRWAYICTREAAVTAYPCGAHLTSRSRSLISLYLRAGPPTSLPEYPFTTCQSSRRICAVNMRVK